MFRVLKNNLVTWFLKMPAHTLYFHLLHMSLKQHMRIVITLVPTAHFIQKKYIYPLHVMIINYIYRLFTGLKFRININLSHLLIYFSSMGVSEAQVSNIFLCLSCSFSLSNSDAEDICNIVSERRSSIDGLDRF